MLYHAYDCDGTHKVFEEAEFEAYIRSFGNISDDSLAAFKFDRLMKGPYMFKDCPFCGNDDDVIPAARP